MTSPEEVWKRMAEVIAHQDNACTADPIFVVQRHRRVYGFDPAYSDDHVVYLRADDYNELSVEERKKEYDEYMASEDTDEKDLGIESYEECLKHYAVRHGDSSDEENLARYARYVESCKEQHFEDWCDNNEGYTKTAYQDHWEHVQSFFTRAGAENYLAINGHNLRGREPPRIYVDSAFRNAEWQAVRALLLKEGLR